MFFASVKKAWVHYLPFLLNLANKTSFTVGGQAVMEGVMMRHENNLALAVRRLDGDIICERKPWFTLTTSSFFKKPFLRGFFILAETLINGVKILNRSTELLGEGTEEELKPWQLVLTLIASLILAIGLFVVLPHFFSFCMAYFGLSADVEGRSFHLWDGLFKFSIFLTYLLSISLLPDVRRVFEYHGAEHKTIHAIEGNDGITQLTACSAVPCKTAHPRCGTTFLLFVMGVSIFLHTLVVPEFVRLWAPSTLLSKHAGTILFKFSLIIPISAISYELIRFTSSVGNGFVAKLLQKPGLVLQRLTTREPDVEQLEVAFVAAMEALGANAPANAVVPEFISLDEAPVGSPVLAS